MANVIVSVIGGLSLGGVYALIALGLVLAFRATATFNFAHGEFMLFPAFIVASWHVGHGRPFGVALVAGLAVSAAIVVFFYAVVLRRAVGLPHFMGAIATFGLAAMLDGIMEIIFGPQDYVLSVPGLSSGATRVLGVRVSIASLVILGFALVLSALIVVLLRYTHLGMLLQAAGQDPVLAAQGGIRVNRMYMASWALAAILAGVAGVAYGSVNVVNFSMTGTALAAFPAIVLGGLDSIEGAVIGGLVIGVLQGFISTYFGGQYINVATYGLLLIVLMILPQGLLGTRITERL
jgi:branched-chain amino acid transport system permease protein